MSEPNSNGGHSNADLMIAMGSKKGHDPIPPDQYLYFLEDDDPEQKALAYVRSKTIRQGHRSPFCVDEYGSPITLTRMAADCGWQPSHTSEYLVRLEEKGLVRVKNLGKAGIRIYLCGDVLLPSRRNKGEENGKETGTSIPRTGKPAEYLYNQINKLTPELQKAAVLRIESLKKLQRDVEAEAIAAARAAVEPMWKQFYTEFGLEKRKLKVVPEKKAAMPRRCAVQISLFDVSGPNYVHGNKDSVQSAKATSYRVLGDAVQSAEATPSINTETETEGVKGSITMAHASSSSFPETTTTTEPEPRPFRTNPELSAIACVAEALQSDDDAAKTLIERCRARVPDIEPQEIAEYVAMKRAQMAGRKKIDNWVGFLLDTVPKMITAARIALYRADKRAAADEEKAADERYRKLKEGYEAEDKAKGAS